MFEFILLGLGFVLVFEGVTYFLLSNKVKKIYEILLHYKAEKIRYFSTVLILAGLILIYFTFKIYKI